MPPYELLLSEKTLEHLVNYKKELHTKQIEPGKYLKIQLSSVKNEELRDKITNEEFLQLILLTKKYKCFADAEVVGDGSDWNATEFKILGDISVAMRVQVYDNGVWKVSDKAFKVHDPPTTAELIYTPGPLLQGTRFRGITPDFEDISVNGKVDQQKYNNHMKRKLLPVFLYVEAKANEERKKALVVIPGLGCGIFAKKFKGQMGEHLNKALKMILKELPNCTNIACVRYDPYNECEDYEEVINNIVFRLRKNTGPFSKSQLSRVEDFEETKGEFDNTTLYKIVAWDHVSFPGNNYFLGSRRTDDGVAGAATNTMEVLTGVKGSYSTGYFLTPKGTRKWITVASKANTKLVAEGNVKIALNDGSLIELSKYKTRKRSNEHDSEIEKEAKSKKIDPELQHSSSSKSTHINWQQE